MSATLSQKTHNDKPFIKKAHVISGSVYVGIPPALVKQFQINDLTFFEVAESDGNLLLKPRRLTA